MSSPSSPHKEVGLRGSCVMSKPKRRKPKVMGLTGKHGLLRRDMSMGHKWRTPERTWDPDRRKWFNNATQSCIYCWSPRFAVENKRCRGRKNNRVGLDKSKTPCYNSTRG